MSDLNTYQIFRGTLTKRFNQDYQQMVEAYDEGSANDFYYAYKNAPLSFVLDHAHEILAETYYGYPFLLNIVTNMVVDPVWYQRILDEVTSYIEKGEKKRIPTEQLDKYKSFQETLIQLVGSYQPLDAIRDLAMASDGVAEFADTVFDMLYDVELSYARFEGDEYCLRNIDSQRDYVAEEVFLCKNPYARIWLGILMLRKYPSYSAHFADMLARILDPVDSPDGYADSRRAINAVQSIRNSELVNIIISSPKNPSLTKRWLAVTNASADSICTPPEDSVETQDEIKILPDGTNIGDLDSFIESMEDDPKTLAARYDAYRLKAEQLDVELDKFYDYEKITGDTNKTFYEAASLMQCNCEAEALMLEWEDDGSPNKVIQKHIMTSKERAAAEEAERREKASSLNNLANANAAAEAAAKSENEICDAITETIKKASAIVPADTDDEKEANAKVIAELRAELQQYKQDIKGKDFKRAEKLCDELKEEILSSDHMVVESADTVLDERIAAFLEGDDDVTGEKAPVQKPKEDLPTKIQNKALDHAAKDEEKLAKKTADRQKLKNAANAVSQKPKRISSDIKDFVSKFDKWDENRRKEFLMKPGFRHKIFKNLKTALMFGSVANVKLAFVPVLGVFKHCSDLKDKRIRNELARELDSEIKICDEKISDANAAGDNQSKYELMRIKDKLESEKTRVRLNSKYI